jgi:predicted transcriptional regulator
MRAVWSTGGGTVDEIRDAMPEELQSGYKTIQTLLNRLAERGLLTRDPGRTARGPTAKITYRAAISEEDYLAESIERTLEGASPEARQLAITQLMGRFKDANKTEGRRRKGGKRK